MRWRHVITCRTRLRQAATQPQVCLDRVGARGTVGLSLLQATVIAQTPSTRWAPVGLSKNHAMGLSVGTVILVLKSRPDVCTTVSDGGSSPPEEPAPEAPHHRPARY